MADGDADKTYAICPQCEAGIHYGEQAGYIGAYLHCQKCCDEQEEELHLPML